MKRKPPKPIRRLNVARKTVPLWKGPVEDGITFSLLSKYLVCRERFRLKVIEGLTEEEGFSFPLEFGSLWHEAEEAFAGGNDWKKALRKYRDRLRANYAGAESEIAKTFAIASRTFPLYVNYWKTHGFETGRQPIFEEGSFRVPYTLPSGRTLTLRGKFDCVLGLGKRSIYLQENKTKGRIDEEGIQRTVDQNLQTMLYQIALRELVRQVNTHGAESAVDWIDQDVGDAFTKLEGRTVKGVLYNVIKRPLSDHHAIKQRKGREVNKKGKDGKDIIRDGKKVKVRVGAETEKDFYDRMADGIKAHPEQTFMRWKVSLSVHDVDQFKDRVFHPILEGLLDWWEWMEADNFEDPWRKDVNGVPGHGVHYQTPWGVYNNIFGGFRGDYFDLLTTGGRSKLTKAKTLFPEL